jgi:hypothetical protein
MSSPLQHYVPHFVLKRFGRGNTNQIYAFDKSTGKTFSGAANKLAAERKFYDFEFMGVSVSLEQSLGELESKTAQCVESILQRGRLATQGPDLIEERSTIIRFLAVQLVRTPGALAKQNDLSKKLQAVARELGAPEDYFKPPQEVGTDQNAVKANFARQICNANKDLGPALLEKDWLLMQTDLKHPFLLRDHPVVTDNYLGGKLGLWTPGSVIYFPLSPEFALGLHCPSIAAQIRTANEKLTGLSDEMLVRHPQFYAALGQTVEILEAFYTGLPLKLQSENIENFNSIQISNAERFVFSCDGNFALVEDMLRANPELRQGPRIGIRFGQSVGHLHKHGRRP